MLQDRSSLRKSVKQEVSAGGVVYRKGDAEIGVLVIRPSRKDDRERWTFPKGWVGDHGSESLEDAALREVKEEGGVEARIIESLGEEHYFFVWEGQRVSKTVHYFLMEYIAGDPNDHDEEVEEARFVPLEKVGEVLSFDTDKKVFARALEHLGV